MGQPLVPGSKMETEGTPDAQPDNPQAIADIKIFWGPEICRLEYLLHLLDTGRVKDDRISRSA